MRYCGIVVGPGHAQLCTLQEHRGSEPPIRLHAAFYEPGAPDGVAAQLRSLGEVVVAIASPATPGPGGVLRRACDTALADRGVQPAPFRDEGGRLFDLLDHLHPFTPPQDAGAIGGAPVDEGSFRSARLLETNVEGVFSALLGARVPARRHPIGVQRRIQALLDDEIVDEGGDLWHRRIEEIEAAAAAACAHRYAVGHACWVGDPADGAIVLPGSSLPERFSADGVLPPVVRLPLSRRSR